MAGALILPAGLAPAAAPTPLPALRQDLVLLPGPPSRHGAPTWTLHDPAAHRFYRIGWLEFEALSRWDLGTAEAVAAAIARETTLRAGADAVKAVARFAEMNDLVLRTGAEATGALLQRRRSGVLDPARWLLKNYLFLRLKLLNPDRLLDRLLPAVGWAFTPRLPLLVAGAALLGLLLVLRQWDLFVAGLADMATPGGALLVAAAIGVSHLLHEFGHGLAAKRFGCRVPGMGVAFLVMWPVLWTDTTEAWKLSSRWQRLAVAGGGIVVELTLATLASIAWALLPDGPLRAGMHVLAATTWITTLLINLNPFMRFDGYYLLSDLIEVPNLQDRSFALGRWWLRERLFGFGNPPPEPLPPATRRLLVGYALGTWTYRFFLFLGIAVLVYHVFFKALGLFLMVVEVWWFVARPILREIGEWAKLRGKVRLNAPTVRTGLVLAGALLLLIVPWGGRVGAPAVLRAGEQAVVFTTEPGRVAEVNAQNGRTVATGELLYRLDSPEIAFRLAQDGEKLRELEARRAAQAVDQELARDGRIAAEEMGGVEAQRAADLARRDRLEIRAPIAGTLTEVPTALKPGTWLPSGEPVGLVVGAGPVLVEAYVREEDLPRLSIGATASFQPRDPWAPPVELRLESVDTASVPALERPELASVNGGPIPVHADRDGRLLPQRSVYRVLLRPVEPEVRTDRIVAGQVAIAGERESIALRLLRHALAVIVRESGWS
ncbi:HlyD family efflux transporter periplasmic adaptor subunit [Rhodocista pekingensis]|uniref:HlyD family efflux transporter periplasmic adaptor subunit n=1 Tax=Rhodocista pekingensis TaxID=201185 RepID=A0ABW2KY12_9PROT